MISPSPTEASSSVSWRRVVTKEPLVGSLSAWMGGTSGAARLGRAQAGGTPGCGPDPSACRADLAAGGGSVIRDPRCPAVVDWCRISDRAAGDSVPRPRIPGADTDLRASRVDGMDRNGWTAWFRITGRDHPNTHGQRLAVRKDDEPARLVVHAHMAPAQPERRGLHVIVGAVALSAPDAPTWTVVPRPGWTMRRGYRPSSGPGRSAPTCVPASGSGARACRAVHR